MYKGIMIDNITILTVSWYSSKYLEKLLDNILQKANKPSLIKFIIIDNSNGEDKDLLLLLNRFKNLQIFNYSPGIYKNLYAHAAALNFGFPKVDTKYALILDPDIYIFKNKWDEFFIKELRNRNAKIIGNAFPSWWLGTYHNFPSPVFSFFETKVFKKLDADWFPFKASFIIQLRNLIFRHIIRGVYLFNRRTLNKFVIFRKIATFFESCFPICSLDTGSKLALKANSINCNILLLTAIYSQDVKKMQELSDTFSVEELTRYYEVYIYNDELIVTHQYGSQNFLLKTKKGKDIAYWYSLINKIEDSVL